HQWVSRDLQNAPGDPRPIKRPPRNGGTGAAANGKVVRTGPAYHANTIAASGEARGKGGTEGRSMRGEVALAYNAARRDEYGSAGLRFSMAGKLANEL